MPLTSKGKRILAAMEKEYGKKKGKQVFYASVNAGTITGVERMARKKKTTARKKRRTPAQIAATKKMIAARKKALRKKNPKKRKVAKRKTTRKKNPRRKKVAKSHLWIIFACKGAHVQWMRLTSRAKPFFGSDKGKAIRFKTKKDAANTAKGIRGTRGWQLGVVSDDTTAAEIKAACSK